MCESREENVYLAKLCEQAERIDEMVAAMKKVAQMDKELTVEERNLFSVAFKNQIGPRRRSWKVITSIAQKEKEVGETKNLKTIKQYKKKIEKEMIEICDDIFTLLDKHLLPCSESEECKVFYYKMKGDYFRYMCEFLKGADRNKAADDALAGYKASWDIAITLLPPTHPVRLGLALNFSVFHYDILNSPEKASELAKQAFEDAIAELEELNDESYRDSAVIMQLLKDNLALWTEEIEAKEKEEA
eukprot:CAMPEP_0174262398 /NCGR_PEP_ID=MMETSP0439-20130205/12950_1 /TAXON_ID=0 /ORGANISM="Stereomyxa ramosa, Strain Chinc5" /LENGTH=244 /DNA_ID=CAMNT_0015347097 /DNA_START=56 /DNA_END=790 /DNA_ORIENTATION=-